MAGKKNIIDAGEPMVVVATQTGFYANKVRYEGERFAIDNPQAFSAAWMVDPNAADAEDTARIEADYASRHARPGSRDISDAALLAEIAQSGGRAEALRVENIQLKGKISELQGQLDQLLAGAKGSRAGAGVRAGTGGEAGGGPATEGAETDAGGLDAGAGEAEEGEDLFGSAPHGDAEGEAQAAGTVRITRRRVA